MSTANGAGGVGGSGGSSKEQVMNTDHFCFTEG